MFKRISLLLALFLLMAIPAYAQDIVLYVNGEAVTREELDEKLKNTKILNQQTSEDLTEEEQQARDERAYQEALTALISERALLQEAENRGFIQDNPDVLAVADQKYQSMLSSVESYVLASYPNLADEELQSQVDSLLKASGASREAYREIALKSAQLAALDDALASKMPEPDSASVEAEYERLYLQQKEQFADQNAFEAAMLQGEVVVHRPVDLKLIQKAEFLFEDGAYGLISQTSAINPDLAEEMKADQFAQLEPKVEAIREALLAGETSFEDVMESCKAGSSQSVNYFHENSTRFGEEYYQRACAFTSVGEVSTAYRMTNGCALLYYADDLPACDRVPLEEVREAISQKLQSESESEWLTQQRTEIVLAAKITYPEE